MPSALLTECGSERGTGGKWRRGGSEWNVQQRSYVDVEFCKNLLKTIAREPGNHGSSQQCCDTSDIDVKQTPLTCMYVLTLYISLFTEGMPYLTNYDPVTTLNNQSQLTNSFFLSCVLTKDHLLNIHFFYVVSFSL